MFGDDFWTVKIISIDYFDSYRSVWSKNRILINQSKWFSLVKNRHQTLIKVFFRNMIIALVRLYVPGTLVHSWLSSTPGLLSRSRQLAIIFVPEKIAEKIRWRNCIFYASGNSLHLRSFRRDSQIHMFVFTGRMALLVTLFLVLVNIFNTVTTNTPKAEGLTAIEAWMLSCILFVFATLIEYACLLFSKDTNEMPEINDLRR